MRANHAVMCYSTCISSNSVHARIIETHFIYRGKMHYRVGLSYILLIYHKSFFQLYAYFLYTSIYNVTNYKYFDVGLYCYCYNCMLNLMILLYWKSFKWLISFAKQETILKKKKTMLDEFILMCLWICFESSKHG